MTSAGSYRDYARRSVRLTLERIEYILEHPEMAATIDAIPLALAEPTAVVRSLSERDVHLYYLTRRAPAVGNKVLRVVVRVDPVDPFVLTAYLTDKMKRGERIWAARP